MPWISPKCWPSLKLIEPLAGEGFHIWRQTRTGLLSYPVDLTAARAHLAASIYVQMALKPHIIHVVGHTEAHHAATADDVIEACLMARRSIENALDGAPDMTADPVVQAQVDHLVAEANVTLQAIRQLGAQSSPDPWTDPANLGTIGQIGDFGCPSAEEQPFCPGSDKNPHVKWFLHRHASGWNASQRSRPAGTVPIIGGNYG